MRILLLCHSFNSLAQRLFVELRERDHDVGVEYDISDEILRESVELFQPDLILAPFLKRAIPADIWRNILCLIVHPGPPGDRGPSALDWALLEGRGEWGVTLIEAAEELDAGPVWAWESFPLRAASKSSHYRHEVTRGAVGCVMAALDLLASGPAPGAARPDGGAAAFLRPRETAHRFCRRQRRGGNAKNPFRRRLAGRACGNLRARIPLLRRAPCAGSCWQTRRVAGAMRKSRRRRCARRRPVDRTFARTAVRIAETSGDLAAGGRRYDLPEAPGYPGVRYEQVGDVGFLHFRSRRKPLCALMCKRARCGAGVHYTNRLEEKERPHGRDEAVKAFVRLSRPRNWKRCGAISWWLRSELSRRAA